MNDIAIRTVESDDLVACHAIEARCFPASEAAWTTSIKDRIDYFPEGFLVAEVDGRVVGQINSGCTDKDDISDEAFKQLVGHDSDGCNMVVFSLSVLPEYRNQSVGSQLLERFVAQSRKMGKSAVKLLCKDDLVPYYQRHGFHYDGLSASTHGDAQWHVMTLPL